MENVFKKFGSVMARKIVMMGLMNNAVIKPTTSWGLNR
jgi:hypothetical protein